MAEIIDDIFQDSTPTIVDCDILEAAKENVQPLASGRRVTSLSAILATPHAAREAKLSATRNRLRVNVELALEDPEDDPLEAYCRFVYWTVDNYPQGQSAESGLLELLEEATRVLKDDRDGVWRGELKYLKLWVLYASFVEKPSVVYKFMLVNDIGTNHALFYEEYALVLERDGRIPETNDDHCPIAKGTDPTPATIPAPKRVALRTTVMSASTPASRPSPAPSSSRPNGKLQVFVDPTGEEPEVAEGNAWSDLGTRKTRVKENAPETQKMAGTKIKQLGKTQRLATAAAATSSGSSTKFVPFRDPAPGDSGDMPRLQPFPRRNQRARGKRSNYHRKVASYRIKTNPVHHPKMCPKGNSYPSRTMNLRHCHKHQQSHHLSLSKMMKVEDHSLLSVMRYTFVARPLITPSQPASTARLAAPETVMKVKKAGAEGLSISSEAEALRRDPLKNYGSVTDLSDD
ncbi:Mitotic spindle checkpoint component mad [Salix suchowensis]|nr:Mitotic spindle checkpoint component mad [Salix suchowensis]